MSESKDISRQDPSGEFLFFFELPVLNAYQSRPEKYVVSTDYFEGEVSLNEDYFMSLSEDKRDREKLRVRFGFRTSRDGTLAVAAFGPDLKNNTSEYHRKKWNGFLIQHSNWIEDDSRLEMWRSRYLLGNWSVDNGPIFYLGELLRHINGLTSQTLGTPLFASEEIESIQFPHADNTHRYQDAHRALYGLLIDGIDKKCLKLLATQLRVNQNIQSDRTLAAIQKLLPELDEKSIFVKAFQLISEQRRKASHKVREPSLSMNAFDQFFEDLGKVKEGLENLKASLESALGFDSKSARERQERIDCLPKIANRAEGHYSICQISKTVGKTIERVEFGSRETNPKVHESEVIIFHFTDGSILGLDTGSNVANLTCSREDISPEDFHSDMNLTWVPPMKKLTKGT